MADIQKVINAWKIFRNSNPYQICDGKEFRAIGEPEYCMSQMIADTIELLEERKQKTAHIYKGVNGFECCSECDKVLPFSFAPYCSYCGAKIEREEAKDMEMVAYKMIPTKGKENVYEMEELVRCKECKYCHVEGENVRYNVCEMLHNKVQSGDWFCADGIRKD